MITFIEHHHTATNERKVPYEVLAAVYAEHASQETVPTEEEFNAVFCNPTLSYHLTNDGYAQFLAQAGRLNYAEPKPDDWYYGKHKIEDVNGMAASDFVEQYQVHVEKVHFMLFDNSVVVLRKVDKEYESYEGYEVFVDTTPNPDFMITPDIRNAIAFMKLYAYKCNEPSKYDELIQKYIDYSKAPL